VKSLNLKNSTFLERVVGLSLRKTTCAKWVKKGEKAALKLFKKTAKFVPAYKDFLDKNGVDPSRINTLKDFRQVPILDKVNYVSAYDFKDLVWNSNLGDGLTIAESSGTAGKPFFWPRSKRHEEETAWIHKQFLETYFQTYHKKTLFIVTFFLGAHIAGMITADSIKRLLDAGMPGALITPGLNKEDTIRIVKEMGSDFEQILLIGYPPFLKDVIVEGYEKGIDWKKHVVKFLFAAESFPEPWRRYLYNFIGRDDEKQFYSYSLNIYGSADLGLMAHETPFTIYLRNLMENNGQQLAGLKYQSNQIPSLFQYYPSNKYFEDIEGELVVTADAGIPLVRYNIHDRGELLDTDEMVKRHNNGEVLGGDTWRLPMIAVYGRSNHSVTFYALNIYPEDIQVALSQKELFRYFTGRFFLMTNYDVNQDQHLEVHLELASMFKVEEIDEVKIVELVGASLRQTNHEYGKLSSSLGERARPEVYIYPYSDKNFSTGKMKNKYLKS